MANSSGFLNEDLVLERKQAGRGKVIPLGGLTKRLVDITLSIVLLVVFSPLFAAAALAIKLCDRGPIFFVHKRVGFSSRQFGCIKFRTMAVDAEQRLAVYLASNKEFAREWAHRRKLKSDPRLISIGEFLRKTSIDELPQLVNVLRGDMSLVGPRPIVVEELRHYGDDAGWYLSVRPGLTGAWQVSGRSDTSYKARVRIDREYCLNWSLFEDITIIIRTIPAVIFARGSY